MNRFTDHQIVEAAIVAAMDALPDRLSLRAMEIAVDVSLEALQNAFAQLHGVTSSAYIQKRCLEAARRDLELAVPGDTVVAVIRRWGFGGDDALFRRSYRATYAEQPSETMRRARASAALVAIEHPAALDGRAKEHVRQRYAGKHKTHSLRQVVERKYEPSVLVRAAEDLVLKMLPQRIDEGVLATSLNVGLRELRGAFRTERGVRPYAALHVLRLEEAGRRLEADPTLVPHIAAQQCGFGYYARFWKDFVAHFGQAPDKLRSPHVTTPAWTPRARRSVSEPLVEAPM